MHYTVYLFHKMCFSFFPFSCITDYDVLLLYEKKQDCLIQHIVFKVLRTLPILQKMQIKCKIFKSYFNIF